MKLKEQVQGKMIDSMQKRLQWIDLITVAVLLILLVGYVYNLTGWLIYDDEGEYLYQVWHMNNGAVPYRDFLTPQLPVFLYSGFTIMKLAGPSLWVMRFFSVSLAFGSALLLYFSARKRGAALTGLLAGALFLLHPDVFSETRIFRNEPLFLFFVTGGLVLATWPNDDRSRLRIAFSGVFFALATMTKLFGLLSASGVVMWFVWRSWRQRSHISRLFIDVLVFGGSLGLTLGFLSTIFVLYVPDFFDLVVGHHLNQGSNLSLNEIFVDKVELYTSYLNLYPLFLLLALSSGLLGLFKQDWRQSWFWQIPTAAAFLILSRQLGQRHFMFLLPSLSILAGDIIATALRGRRGRFARFGAMAALMMIILTWVPLNAERATWVDTDTKKLVKLIKQRVTEGETILADDIGLAYYAQRPTTYSGAALSEGAASSGQITGEGLIEEIIRDDVKLILVDESLVTGDHLVRLRDYPRFHRFLEKNFEFEGKIWRDFEEIAIWVRREGQTWQTIDTLNIVETFEAGTKFGDSINLMGYSINDTELQPGEGLEVTLYWTAEKSTSNSWKVFTHLISSEGELVAQHDKYPYDGLYPSNRWWPDQIIDDDYLLHLPERLEPGEYYLELGMYDEFDDERLFLRSITGEPVSENKVRLPTSILVIAN